MPIKTLFKVYLGSAEKLLLFRIIAVYMNIHCNQVQEKKGESVQNACTLEGV